MVNRRKFLTSLQQLCLQKKTFCSALQYVEPKICIVGSGPAGFYTAQHILKNLPEATIDIYERLPAPFGLVRYGVAPDHPDVKNVIHSFTATALSDRVKFLGNVAIGKDVTLADLRKAYNLVILAYGAAQDRWLGIPGETLPNVVSARNFVGWYNGLPEDKDLQLNMDVEEAVIIGNGNVALDVARILVAPIDELKKTDICRHSLDVLSGSRIKRVTMIGRRGPLQVAFTIKEFREIINMPNVRPVFHMQEFGGIEEIVPELPRPRKRLTELMLKTAKNPPSRTGSELKTVEFKFWRSPLEILGNGTGLKKVILGTNKSVGPPVELQKVEATGETEELQCGLLLKSIGYKSIPLADELPFDSKRGIILNEGGRVVGMPDVYCSGWVSTGAVGVIGTTMNSAFAVANLVLSDLKDKKLEEGKGGDDQIRKILLSKGVVPVDFRDWLDLDAVEVQRGDGQKPREKIIDVNEMLRVLKERSQSS